MDSLDVKILSDVCGAHLPYSLKIDSQQWFSDFMGRHGPSRAEEPSSRDGSFLFEANPAFSIS